MDWLTIMWAINVLGYLLLYWWIVVNNWRQQSEWSFLQFGALFCYGVLLFFCAALILPKDLREGVDLISRFERIRKPFFVLWILVFASELVDSFMKGVPYVMNNLGFPYIGLISFSIAVSLLGFIVASRQFQFAAAITFLLYMLFGPLVRLQQYSKPTICGQVLLNKSLQWPPDIYVTAIAKDIYNWEIARAAPDTGASELER